MSAVLQAPIEDTEDGPLGAGLAAHRAAIADAYNAQQENATYGSILGNLNTDNYVGAFQAAEGSTPTEIFSNASQGGDAKTYGGGVSDTIEGASPIDPLTQLMESSQGLTALDPTKQWTSSDVTNYYNALFNPAVDNGGLGENPYGLWGNPGAAASDAAANIAQHPGAAPNVDQYAGAQPGVGTFTKWGVPIIGAALSILAPELGPELAAADGATVAAADVGLGAAAGLTSSAIEGGNPLEGLLLGGLGGVGSALAPGLASTLQSNLGLGATAAGIGANSVIGAGTGAIKGAVTGTGALTGAELGGVNGLISGGINASGANSALQNAGLSNTGANILTGAAGGALKGTVDAGITGGNPALGAAGGALTAGGGAAINGALNTVGSVFTGSDPTQTDNGGISSPGAVPPYLQPNNASNMPYNPFTYDGAGDITDPTGDPTQYPTDPSTNGNGPLIDPNTIANLPPGFANIQPISGSDLLNNNPGIDPGSQGDLNLGTNGSGSNPLAALLSKLLGGGGGGGGSAAGGAGGTSGLLAQLLGLGSTAAGGALNTAAAKGAASTFAGQTQFNPYGINTNNGSTTFNGTNATSTLAPGAQSTADGLTGLNNGLIGSLAAGPGADATANFNALTSSQLQAQQRLMANTQDNEFANGVLGSTAGQYQTQGALGAIGSQISGDQVTANNMAATQQQDQLAQLTAGLNGSNQINSSQLAQIAQGSNTGSQAGGINLNAFQPSLAANSNSNIGNLLTGIGNGITTNSGQANNSALAQFLASLGQG
jgi:hypothetical protein